MRVFNGSVDDLKNDDNIVHDTSEDDSSSNGGRSSSSKYKNDAKKLKKTNDEGGGFRSRQKRQIRNRRKRHTGKRKFESEESENKSENSEIDVEKFKSDDEEVKYFISDMVSERTKTTYRNANITFLMWIYEEGTYKRRLLRENYIKEMDEAKEMKQQRNVSKKWLDGIQCEDDCPIFLCKLTFNFFSRYLAKRKESSSGRYLSKSTYGSIQSSICHLFLLCDRIFPDNFSTDLSKMMSGKKKRIQRRKQKKGFRIEEGKTPMSLQIYSILCNYFM